jgi:hypothetical protein
MTDFRVIFLLLAAAYSGAASLDHESIAISDEEVAGK